MRRTSREWLLGQQRDATQKSLGKRKRQQFGPVRDGKAFQAALSEMNDHNRRRVVLRNRKHVVELNPVLDRKPSATSGTAF